MSEPIRHWSSDSYWTDALEKYGEIRSNGISKIEIDLQHLEEKIFGSDSPAYKMVDAMQSVREHEGWEGERGAPRLILALMALLHEANSNS